MTANTQKKSPAKARTAQRGKTVTKTKKRRVRRKKDFLHKILDVFR